MPRRISGLTCAIGWSLVQNNDILSLKKFSLLYKLLER